MKKLTKTLLLSAMTSSLLSSCSSTDTGSTGGTTTNSTSQTECEVVGFSVSDKQKYLIAMPGNTAFITFFPLISQLCVTPMAAATIFVIPVVILFLVCQKNFVEGIATSGIKAYSKSTYKSVL